MKNVILLIIISFLAVGCAAGVDIDRHASSGYQQITQWKNSAFGPNTNFAHYFICDKESIPDGEYEYILHTEGKNCKPIKSETTHTTGVVNQLAMPAAVGVGSFAIGSGLEKSGTNISNDSGSISGAGAVSGSISNSRAVNRQ